MASMYPTEVVVNEKNIQKVVGTYKTAYKQILSEIGDATDWGVANRRAILGQIEGILTDLGTDVNKFIEKEIPAQYKSGADDAIKQLKNIDAPIDVATGFNRIHRDAITALVDETAKAFGEGIAGVNRSAQLVFGRMSREAITQKLATGMIQGSALREVRQQIKGQLLEDGLDALVDRGGRSWTLDRYADMLFRTKSVETRNRGIANRLVENGYDLVQVSNHRTDHAECAVWEGKILSASGATKGYPTVREAEAAGLFHPNCKHAINVLVPKLASKTRAYDPDTKTLTPAGASIRKPIEEVIQTHQLDKAHIVQDDFKATMEKFGGNAAPPKGMESTYNKVVRDYNGDVSRLKDVNRGYVLIKNPHDENELKQVKKQISQVYPIDEAASKNKLTVEEGYAYSMVNVKLPDGRIGEVQITYEEMWTAKTTRGEDLYKLIGNGKDPDGKLMQEMLDLYAKARQAALARIG